VSESTGQYHLFAWPDYEAAGGVHDWWGSYATVDAAKFTFENEDRLNHCDLADIVVFKDNDPDCLWRGERREVGSSPARLTGKHVSEVVWEEYKER
jgi:hypothetical protein